MQKYPDLVLSLFFGLLLSQMESSIVATSLLDIARAFNDFIRIQWVVLSYLLTYMGKSLTDGKVSMACA